MQPIQVTSPCSKIWVSFKFASWGLNDQSDLGKDYELSIFKSLF